MSDTLRQHIYCLGTDKLRRMYSVMIDAGLKHEYSVSNKKLFNRLRADSKGREKKIYAALAKASKTEYELMFSALTEFN